MTGSVWEILGVRKAGLEGIARSGADAVPPVLRIRLGERLRTLARMRGERAYPGGEGPYGGRAWEGSAGGASGSRYIAEFRFSPRQKPRAESGPVREAQVFLSGNEEGGTE